MSLRINKIPHKLLKRLNATRAVLLTTADEPGVTYVSTYLDAEGYSLDPAGLNVIHDFEALAERRAAEGVYSIMALVLRLDTELIEEAGSHLDNRYRIMAELDAVVQHNRDVYVVYVVTHYNAGPLGPLTVHIGGDCYRTDPNIKDLESILDRTKDLAEAMLKKAVMIFPDNPALHGGKKGEWIILDRDGKKIEGISEEAIVALGSVAIPRGIRFLNRAKENRARQQGIVPAFPAQNYVRPDTGSPDVLSGVYWRGERKDKYISMCHVWQKRGLDMAGFTCLPADLGGTRDSSARPTGYGVATTAMELAQRYFGAVDQLQFVLEAAGNVGRNTIEALIDLYHIPAAHITVFDKDNAACDFVKDKFHVNAIALNNEDFYLTRLPEDAAAGVTYDVWINNGEGNNTRPAHIENLLRAGVRLFCGGANNFLHVATQEATRQLIFAAGGWAWPDPATSGGGWTLAVMDVATRCQGHSADTPEIRAEIVRTIVSRNAGLVRDVFTSLGGSRPDGLALWNKVDEIIQARVAQALAQHFTPDEIRQLADASRWQLRLPA